MTTIALDSKCLVVDRRCGHGDSPQEITSQSETEKYIKLFDEDELNILITGSGNGDILESYAYYIKNGRLDRDFPHPKEEFSTTILECKCSDDWKILSIKGIMMKDEDIYYKYYNPGIKEHRFDALGSGREYALGAMSAGAGAEEAVIIASRHDKHTSPEIDVFRFHPHFYGDPEAYVDFHNLRIDNDEKNVVIEDLNSRIIQLTAKEKKSKKRKD